MKYLVYESHAKDQFLAREVVRETDRTVWLKNISTEQVTSRRKPLKELCRLDDEVMAKTLAVHATEAYGLMRKKHRLELLDLHHKLAKATTWSTQ